MALKQSLHYKDIFLIPSYSECTSRSLLDTTCKIGNSVFNLPVIPANMKCCIDPSTVKILYDNQYPYIMHRFNDTFNFVRDANEINTNFISISIGVKNDDIELLNKIKSNNFKLHCITIDIAHGHCLLMKEMINHAKKLFPEIVIVAGNIGTPEAADDLTKWGASILKVGLGGGSVCTTKLKTGVITPMFSTIYNIANREYSDYFPHIPIIADGGISCTGDIVKALVAGASFVMCGKLFAELYDSPAYIINNKKEYYGSASQYNKHHTNNIEGKRELIDIVPMSYLEKLKEIKQDVQSAISYSGYKKISDLSKMKWYIQNI